MYFWFFMLGIDMLLPLTMICFGGYFMKKAPKDVNAIFGYRTAMSMKNKETWEFAHHYSGKLWNRLGMILLPVTILIMILFIHQDIDIISIIGGIVCAVQLIPLIAVIILTENALRKNYDKDGNRR